MQKKYVLTLIAPKGTLLHVPRLVSNLPVEGEQHWLNDCNKYNQESTALDIPLSRALTNTERTAITTACNAAQIDFVLQPIENREKKLLISDMDSTMIEQECIDEMADVLGLKDKVAPITERAMRGELSFEPALRERVALLKDLPESTLQQVYDTRISLMPGAKTLLATMKQRGATTHLVSGGFTFFTQRVANALGFDTHDANQLHITDGKLAGTVAEPILGKEAKRMSLNHYAAQHNVPLAATLAIGDGANDLPMLTAAGLGIAHHAKPDVQAALPDSSIRYNDLTALLYAQGIERSKWVWREPANGINR